MTAIPIETRCSGLCTAHCPPHARDGYDPVPGLAALLDGITDLARASASPAAMRDILGRLLAGPHAGLRGGLLLDEPGRELVPTAGALHEALKNWYAVTDGRQPGDEQIRRMLRSIELADAHLDDAGPQWAKDCPQANMYRRIGKAQLEAAEAMEELSLLTGENPRKAQDPAARDRMLAELGDTAVAALLGIQSATKDVFATWAVFTAALDKAVSRVPAPDGMR